MTDTSVDAEAPPGQELDLIAAWGNVRLEDHGNGHAAVTMVVDGERRTVALVEYGDTAATSTVRWNRTGTIAVEQFKRDALDTKIYSRIAQWLRGQS